MSISFLSQSEVSSEYKFFEIKIIKKIIGPMNNNLFREIERVVK